MSQEPDKAQGQPLLKGGLPEMEMPDGECHERTDSCHSSLKKDCRGGFSGSQSQPVTAITEVLNCQTTVPHWKG